MSSSTGQLHRKESDSGNKTLAPTGSSSTTSQHSLHHRSRTNLLLQVEDDRTGIDVHTLQRAFFDNLFYLMGKLPEFATTHDYYSALAYTVRDRILHRWLNTVKTYLMPPKHKLVAYFSAEFLIGPQLGSNLLNLGLGDLMRDVMTECGLDLDILLAQEPEPGLGNGGLGRLAACFMDSMATLELPAISYGIRYEFGIFSQAIKDGWQVEKTDKWLHGGNPWEIARPESTIEVGFGGRTEAFTDRSNRYCVRWIPSRVVNGVPYDTPIIGYHVNTANTMRLWKAVAVESFDVASFNFGDYYGAVSQKVMSETISKILYPSDEKVSGKRLRLEQQYFFVCCSLKDMIRLHLGNKRSIETFHQSFAAQLNDTHPAIGVAELMRILLDEHYLTWEVSWGITTRVFSYTNHTLLPEALEKWPLDIFGSLLPRHLEIIFEINHRFLEMAKLRHPGDVSWLQRLSIIDESGPRYVRMAHLAVIGSHHVNGVAELHSTLLKNDVLKDFFEIWPEKFINITNGITPRRFLQCANPSLSALITSTIGSNWTRDLCELKKLIPFADDAAFRHRWRDIKRQNKFAFANFVQASLGVEIMLDSLFDVQIKRLHEYKRQHMNILHIVTLYQRLKRNQDPNSAVRKSFVPRTFIFAGKAAPGYFMAKLIIKLINAVADVVNNDKDINGFLRVVFVPNYNIRNAVLIIPAADLSEQISTAGKEASGTGNMKLSLNGALTIATLDGANIEIREEVGKDNIFEFGLTAPEIARMKSIHSCRPQQQIESDWELQECLGLIGSGFFSGGDVSLFAPLIQELTNYDQYMLMADFRGYVECQERVSRAFRDQEIWTRMSIFNVANMGKFSSDRAIQEYARIWGVERTPVLIDGYSQMKSNHMTVKQAP